MKYGTSRYAVTRTIPPKLAPLLELLELERPSVVTVAGLAELARTAGVPGRPNALVARLAGRGWLLPTGARGSWEFIPADRAGRFGSQDPWLPLRGVLESLPDLPVRVALGSALWLMDLADRAPDRPEIAVPPRVRLPLTLAQSYRVTRFAAVLPAHQVQGLPVEAPASLLVHLAERPAAVRSWEAVLDALPLLLDRVTPADLAAELDGRTAATQARCGYLVAPYAPEIVAHLNPAPGGTTWFGPRGAVRRYDARWRIVDTLLPRAPGAGQDPR
jgi:hypothetical protein